jgi:hypothetical protein
MKMLISWTRLIDGVSSGGSQDVEDWADLRLLLNTLQENAGSLRLVLVDGPDPGQVSMHFEAENQKYLVTLLEDTGEDMNVREYDNPTASAEMVDILGDSWDARQLTDDFDLVVMLFKEFFETGDVSRQWLN